MIKVGLEVSPLGNAHAKRGIGSYTRLLEKSLQSVPELEVSRWSGKEKVDVVHYPYFDLFTSTLPLIKPTRTVVTIHDVIPLLFPKHYPVGVRGKVALTRQIVSLRSVKAVVAPSYASQHDIADYLHVPLEKIHVVYEAANPDLQAQSEEKIKQVKKNYQLPKDYLLYVGDINYNKNVPQLIKALKFIPESVHLVCVGSNFFPHDIPEWQEIETQAALSNVTDRIHYLREIASDNLDELAALYSGALAYIQPSLAEGFGLPVLEAMQCRTPVICASNTSLLEIAGPQAVMVSPDAEHLADAVELVMNWSKTHRQEVIREAYKWSQTFSWDKAAREMLAIYQQVVA